MGNRAGSQDLIELGNRIRDRRNEISMSQEKVAEQAGISANTVSRIEGGQSAMSIEIFIKMVQIPGRPQPLGRKAVMYADIAGIETVCRCELV